MTDTGSPGGSEPREPRYTRAAVAAVTRAARVEHDFGGWLAAVLADAAGRLGSSDALTAGRPGSWEAALVDQLVKGTVGYGDEYLPRPPRRAGQRAKLTETEVRLIRDEHAAGGTQRHIAGAFGVSASTVSAIATGKTWRWLP